MATITAISEINFHRNECHANDINRNDGIDCNNELITLEYRCSECSAECIKCLAFRINTSEICRKPFVRGCEEARRAISNIILCTCSEAQGCEELADRVQADENTLIVAGRAFFHEDECPPNDVNLNDGINCNLVRVNLEYRCLECFLGCIKCLAPRLNTNEPYVIGCKEARRAIDKAPVCICSEDQPCHV